MRCGDRLPPNQINYLGGKQLPVRFRYAGVFLSGFIVGFIYEIDEKRLKKKLINTGIVLQDGEDVLLGDQVTDRIFNGNDVRPGSISAHQ